MNSTRRDFIRIGLGTAALGIESKRGAGFVSCIESLCRSCLEKQELEFTSARSFSNPYTDVMVWVDLSGPGFDKRIYGFWNGENKFCVRLLANTPGAWNWRSGSEPFDAGLAAKTGSFQARDWTEKEKEENPLRRGFLQPTPNRHALQTADGQPFFVIGDTWYAAGTNRFR